MKIHDFAINNSLYKTIQPGHNISFCSMGFTFGTYTDCYGTSRETQNTTGKRNDISLEDFAKIVQKRFSHFDKVNIMPMNVSDGTEAYLFANAIIRNEGWETFVKKYSPIKASDVMPNVINNYAKNGLLHLYDNEIKEFDRIDMNVITEVDKEKYKELIISQIGCPEKLYKLNDEYRKHFNFRVEDLQSRILDLKDEGNSVIAIRNCLRQSFGERMSSMIIFKLFMQMRGASLLITGDYDRQSKLINDALNNHFTELKKNIWGLKDYGYLRNYLTKFRI